MIDFDAFLAEQRAAAEGTSPPVMFRVGGKEYPLPRTLPAVIALDIIRMQKDLAARAKGGKVLDLASTEALTSIGEAFFGVEGFRTILIEQKLGVPELGALITQAFGAYSAEVTTSADPVPNPEAQAATIST